MNWMKQSWENRAIYRYHFLHSTYISSIWAWFLTFWGKAAEPFLCVSVLYSGAKLMPGVSTDPMLDTIMFIGQMLALDIGGLSLGKIAQQLEREGSEEQARFIKKVSIFLIGLMIANVVLATVQHLFPQIDPIWITGCESSLLIVRSIMAVIYGYIIYNLHPHEKQDNTVVKSADVKSQFEELVNALTALENKLNAQTMHLNQRMREEITQSLHVHTASMNHQFASVLSEQLASVQMSLHQELAMMQTSLQQQLASLQVQAHHSSDASPSARMQVTHVQAAKPQRANIHALPTRKQQDASLDTQTHPREFVFSCLHANASLRLSEIEQLARASGLQISQSQISRYRKQWHAHTHASSDAS